MSLSLIMRGIYPQLSQETMSLIHSSAWKGNSPKFTFTILHSPSLIDLSQPHHRTVKSSMPHYILWSWIKIQVAEC